MSKLVRFLATPALVLVLSLAIMSTGAFAQHVDLNAAHGALSAGAAQPANATRTQGGPSPIDTGNGGSGPARSGGFGGPDRFGGIGRWSNHICTNHHCGPFGRSIKKCVHLARTDRSFLSIKRQSILACRWIKAERW